MIVTYRTAEVVALLRDRADTLTGNELESGAADDRLLRAVVERFPHIGPAQMAEVVQAYEHEVDAEESEVEEQEELVRRYTAFFEDLCRRNGLGGDPTMLVGEALRVMAWSGDADAAQLLAMAMTPQARAERNTLVAAYDAHPAWTSDGIVWGRDEAAPGPRSNADLVDWYQRTHPREAAAMEAAAARPVVPFQARGGRARLKMHGAWRVALNRVVTIEEAPPITLAWMLSAEMEHRGTDIVPVERVLEVVSNIYPRPTILSGLYRLEDLGAIIITPKGVRLSISIVEGK